MMRDKQRYLLVESSSNVRMDERLFSHSIQHELAKCIGEIQYHRVNPKFVKFLGDNRFVMRSSLEGSPQLILAFSLMKRIEGAEVAFYTLKSSGTIRSLDDFSK